MVSVRPTDFASLPLEQLRHPVDYVPVVPNDLSLRGYFQRLAVFALFFAGQGAVLVALRPVLSSFLQVISEEYL